MKLVVIRLTSPPRNEKISKHFTSKLDLTLFGIPTRYNLYSITKISCSIYVALFTKVLTLVVLNILKKQHKMLT